MANPNPAGGAGAEKIREELRRVADIAAQTCRYFNYTIYITDFLVNYFSYLVACAAHGRRKTVMIKDSTLLKFVRGEDF